MITDGVGGREDALPVWQTNGERWRRTRGGLGVSDSSWWRVRKWQSIDLLKTASQKWWKLQFFCIYSHLFSCLQLFDYVLMFKSLHVEALQAGLNLKFKQNVTLTQDLLSQNVLYKNLTSSQRNMFSNILRTESCQMVETRCSESCLFSMRRSFWFYKLQALLTAVYCR